MNPLYIIGAYLLLLVCLGGVARHFFRGTSQDFFVASRSIGPFLLVMSVFGTSMTSFTLIGSTGEAYRTGIGVYGMMASWSGLVHSAVIFLVGIRLWAIGKRHNFLTQIQYFRARFESNGIGYLLFPILVGLVVPYLLMGLLGAGAVVKGVTPGMFPEAFPAHDGAVPPWITNLVICTVVLSYVFFGGLRGAAWANAFQTMVFLVTAVVAFYLISNKLGGVQAATASVVENAPQLLARAGQVNHLKFLTYALIPISIGMFPHIFQHWLTARSARAFRLTLVAHPLFMMLLWTPCILIGIWAAGIGVDVPPNQILGHMVGLLESPVLMGLLTAGILAAIMSSLDSQFVCIGTMFTQDIVVHRYGERRFTDRQKTWMGRGFVVMIVTVTYLLSLAEPRAVFGLGVWCFSGFSSLFPVVFAALYWKRVTRVGAIACVLVTTAVWLALFSQSDFGKIPVEPFGLIPVVYTFSASVLTLVLVSLLTRPPATATVAKFFPTQNEQEIADHPARTAAAK